MLKRLCAIALLCGFAEAAHALQVEFGTITNVAVGVDNIAVYVTAGSGSTCASGWFYSFTSDSNDPTMNRLLATIMASWTTGVTVSFYATSAVCNQGTNSRFTSLQTH